MLHLVSKKHAKYIIGDEIHIASINGYEMWDMVDEDIADDLLAYSTSIDGLTFPDVLEIVTEIRKELDGL